MLRTIFSDWRLILALPVAILLRYVLDAAMTGGIDVSALEDDAPAVVEDRGGYQGNRGDGSFHPSVYKRDDEPGVLDWLFSPLSIAAMGGGLIFAVGAVGAYRIWQAAEDEDAEDEAPSR